MHPRIVYEISQWKPRALRRAKSLVGKEWTERELEIIAGYKTAYPEDDGAWASFMAYGIRPEMQSYVDHTIKMIERLFKDEESSGDYLVAWVRLQWSCKELLAN